MAVFLHVSSLILLTFSAAQEPTLLEVATGVATWLEKTAEWHEDTGERACSWRMNSTDDAPAYFPYLSTSLYYGSPGVAIFLSQLAESSIGNDQPRWQALTQAAIDDVRNRTTDDIRRYAINAGFYYGLTGISWSLREMGGKLTDPSSYLRSAVQIEKHILTEVLPFSSKPGARLWNNTDIAHGASGTGLALLRAAGEEADPSHARDLLAGAVAAGKWLLQQAQPMSDGAGWRWWRGPDTDGEHTHSFYPTFCCGTAGVGYFLAELGLTEGLDPETRTLFAQAAQQAGRHVLAMAVEGKDGSMLLPHGEQGSDTSEYYLGWCGGAPGWARLFIKLWQVSRDTAWLEALEKAIKGTEASVLPNLSMMLPVGKQGVWQNLGQCCGAAAAGNFLLAIAQSDLPLPTETKTQAQVSAQQIAEAIVMHAVADAEGIVLPSAEEHLKPLDTRWQAGWMQGVSGIASFLLDLHAVNAGRHEGRRRPWPDEPWHTAATALKNPVYV